MSSASQAEAISSPPHSWVIQAIIVLGGILIAQAIIPIVKSWFQQRAQRKTYRNYLLANTENALDSFGEPCSVDYARQALAASRQLHWLDMLEANNAGVPEFFLTTHRLIDKALQSSDYIPSVSYFGCEKGQLEQESPVWRLKSETADLAVRYFLTQKQVETALTHHYTGWFFSLAQSDKQQDRERWCLALDNVLLDLAEHYTAAKNLNRALKKQAV